MMHLLFIILFVQLGKWSYMSRSLYQLRLNWNPFVLSMLNCSFLLIHLELLYKILSRLLLTFLDHQALSYRVGHHSTSDDSTKYRPVDEIEHWKTARNPLARFRKWVHKNGWWTDDEESELRGSIRKQVKYFINAAYFFL